ncbi:MAG: hypothetical protein AB7P48_15255, partial [Methylocystis sp.]
EWFITVFVYRHSRRKRRRIEYRRLRDFVKGRLNALWKGRGGPKPRRRGQFRRLLREKVEKMAPLTTPRVSREDGGSPIAPYGLVKLLALMLGGRLARSFGRHSTNAIASPSSR